MTQIRAHDAVQDELRQGDSEKWLHDGRYEWIIQDLKASGLSPLDFPVEPLTSESELEERLGRTTFNGVRLIEIGGYWIPYPNVPGYYRLKLREQIKGAKYLSPIKEKGFGVPPYILPEVHELLKTYSPDKPVFITEGEKKAAKMTLSGFPCIGIPGVWNGKDIESDFLPDQAGHVWKDRKVNVVFDSDIVEKHGVRHAELRFAIEYLNKGATIFSVRLPNEPDGQKNGADDYLVKYGAEKFNGLVEAGMPTLELHVSEGTDTSLILRELPRLKNEILKAQVLKSVAKREGVSVDVVQKEYQKCLPSMEEANESPGETFTTEQMENAEALLKSPDILDRMIVFNKARGFTGEELNQRLLYLSFTSRLMNASISTVVKGQSSSGKSYLTGTVIKLFPESDVMNFSFITGKALVHRQDDLSHKILYIAEHSGGEGAEYSIRTLLSEGEISIMLPVKNENTGHFETIEKRIPAKGLVFVETTTRDRIHYENETRLFDLYVDESPEQTRHVLEAQATQVETDSPEVEDEVMAWRCAQNLLIAHEVYIPYAEALIEGFPVEKVRARRDYPKLLNLIRSHTLLHQYQREVDEKGRLVATFEDFESILPLAETALAQSMKDVTPQQEAVFKAMRENFSDRGFTAKELSAIEGMPPHRTVQRFLEWFVKEGMAEWNGKKGAASRYRVSNHRGAMAQFRLFPPNFLESLKYTAPIANGAMWRNGAMLTETAPPRQTAPNGNGVLNSNNNEDLSTKMGDCATAPSLPGGVCVPGESKNADEAERLKKELASIELEISRGSDLLTKLKGTGRNMSHVEKRVTEQIRERDQVLKKLSTLG